MRNLVVIVLALVLTVSAASQPPAAAILAEHVPSDVLMYVEFSVSGSTIQGIDSLIANLSDRIGVEAPPTFDGIVQILGLRAWLGGRGALAVLPAASLYGLQRNAVGLLQIRDRAAVESYLVDGAQAMPVPNTRGDWSIFVLNGISISVSDNLVVAAVGLAGATLPGPNGPSLATHQPYLDAMAALPGEDYAATAYLDPQGLVFAAAGMATEVFDAAAVNLPALSDSLGVVGAGLSQLDDRTYALDIAHLYGSRHLFEALYAPVPPVISVEPIDPDWLSLLPDDVAFAGQTTGAWSQLRTLLEALSIGGNAIQTRALVNSRLFEDMTGVDPVSSPLAFLPPSLTSAGILNTLEGLLDLSDAELSAAFDGQAAVALRLRESASAPALDTLLAVESSGLDAGHKVLNGVRSLLPLLNLSPVEAGDDLMIFAAPGGAYESRLELLADYNALYFGSESLILAGKETLIAVPRLTESEPFIHDRAWFLPGATNLAYIHLPPLRAMFGLRSERGGLLLPDSVELRNLVDSFDSFWISGRTEPGRSILRAAFTLTE